MNEPFQNTDEKQPVISRITRLIKGGIAEMGGPKIPQVPERCNKGIIFLISQNV
jgi:hypothetical protein